MKKHLTSLVALFTLFICIVSLFSCGNNDTSTCSACGAENSANVKFCSNCGNAFDNDESNENQNNNVTQNNGDNTNNGNSSNNSNGEPSISTAKDFLNKIASNTTISLGNVNLNFGSVTGINNSCVEKSEYGYYIIKNVENLTISGTETTISSNVNIETYFLVFDNCKNITISGVNFNSINYDQYFYTTFLSFENCSGVNVNNCKFDAFGEGVSFYKCESAIVAKSEFNNLNSGAVSAYYSNVSLSQCNIKNITDASTPLYCSGSTFNIRDCSFSDVHSFYLIWDNTASIFSGKSYDESDITFTNCSFKDNAIDSVFVKTILGEKNEEYDLYDSYDVYEHTKLQFNNCNFNNNLYCYGSFATNNFVNCTLSNNNIGIKIPDITGWGESYIESKFAGLDYTVEFVYDDMETDLRHPISTVIAQSKKGVVSQSDSHVVLTVLKPAITIQNIYFEINSAGGVEPDIKFTNNTNKQIAYVYFTVKFYDRMGSPAYCSIKNTTVQRLDFTGPLNAGVTKYPSWNPVIYNSTVGAIKPLKIEVVFTDGSRQTITNTTAFWSSGAYYGGELRD